MVSNEEADVPHAHGTRTLQALLWMLEILVRFGFKHNLPLSWTTDEEARISIIKSELGRRGMF